MQHYRANQLQWSNSCCSWQKLINPREKQTNHLKVLKCLLMLNAAFPFLCCSEFSQWYCLYFTNFEYLSVNHDTGTFWYRYFLRFISERTPNASIRPHNRCNTCIDMHGIPRIQYNGPKLPICLKFSNCLLIFLF